MFALGFELTLKWCTTWLRWPICLKFVFVYIQNIKHVPESFNFLMQYTLCYTKTQFNTLYLILGYTHYSYTTASAGCAVPRMKGFCTFSC